MTERSVRPTPSITVPFGRVNIPGRAPFDVAWSSHSALNGHMLLIGGSGAGKTYQLRRILGGIAKQGVRIHLIDVHGDITPDCPTDTVRFSESTQFGLNPLAVSADPDFGGVRKKANGFVSLLGRQMTLGDKQKTALFRLLVDLYKGYGFEMDDPKTWSLEFDPRSWAKQAKRYPTIGDLRRHVDQRRKMMKFGMTGAAVRAFEAAAKLQAQLHRLRLRNLRGDDVEGKLATAKDKALEAFSTGLEKMEQGSELDEVLAWDNPDVVAGIYDRVERLEGSGIFKGEHPPFDPSVSTWRYDIKALSREEQQFFVDCLCEQLFFDAKQRGEAEAVDTVIVVDEASIFVDKDPDHILNIIFREARKFGVGVILASQSIDTFSKDIITSSAVKALLGIDEMFHRSTENRLGLPNGKLKFIKPQETALIQVKNRGKGEGLTNRFWEVNLGR